MNRRQFLQNTLKVLAAIPLVGAAFSTEHGAFLGEVLETQEGDWLWRDSVGATWDNSATMSKIESDVLVDDDHPQYIQWDENNATLMITGKIRVGVNDQYHYLPIYSE
jgi:hypothetical protein